MTQSAGAVLGTATEVQGSWTVVERAVAQETRKRRAIVLARWSVCALAAVSALFVIIFGLHVELVDWVLFLTTPLALSFFRQWFVSEKQTPDTPLLTTLREHPKKIVWIFVSETRDVFGLVRRVFVVIGRSNGRMLHLLAGSTDSEVLLSALSALAPSAEVGYSELRMELYMRHPKRPPRVRGPMSGPQLAGVACAGCGERLVTAAQGSVCTDCDAPVHIGCVAKHAMTAHFKKSGVPYR